MTQWKKEWMFLWLVSVQSSPFCHFWCLSRKCLKPPKWKLSPDFQKLWVKNFHLPSISWPHVRNSAVNLLLHSNLKCFYASELCRSKNQHIFLSSHKNQSIRWVNVCIVWNLQHENGEKEKQWGRERVKGSAETFIQRWVSAASRTFWLVPPEEPLNVCGRQTDSKTLKSKQHKFRVFKMSG